MNGEKKPLDRLRMGIGKGVALVLIIRKTDFHAYYTNDFIIFDVSAGAGRTQKPGRRL